MGLPGATHEIFLHPLQKTLHVGYWFVILSIAKVGEERYKTTIPYLSDRIPATVLIQDPFSIAISPETEQTSFLASVSTQHGPK